MQTKKKRTLTTTELRRGLSRVLSDISRRGQSILVERNGHPIVMITGVKEKKRKHQLLLAREAFGMWANRKDINDNWVKAGRSRWVSAWRDG